MTKIYFFSETNLVTAKKKTFKIFFQLLKVKMKYTYRLNIYIFVKMLMFFKKSHQKLLKQEKLSNFFQNAQNHGFRNFDF